MMFGVVVCSRCGKARAVDLNRKTVLCECNAKVNIREAKPYFKSDSQIEVAEAVRQFNARLSDFPKAVLQPAKMAERSGDLQSSLNAFFGGEEKSRTQLKRLLTKHGYEKLDEAIERLLAAGIIYETRKDHFRLV